MLPINVSRLRDVYCVYRMPQLIVEFVFPPKTKEAQIRFLNLHDICNSIATRYDYILTYFAVQLKTYSRYDKQKRIGIVYQVSNEIKLADIFIKFINDFVLCPMCDFPEVEVVKAKINVKQSCRVCGHKRLIKEMDLDAEFKDFVLRRESVNQRVRKLKI